MKCRGLPPAVFRLAGARGSAPGACQTLLMGQALPPNLYDACLDGYEVDRGSSPEALAGVSMLLIRTRRVPCDTDIGLMSMTPCQHRKNIAAARQLKNVVYCR